MKFKNTKEMTFLPVSINITGKRILIIGGGKVALHKIQLLQRFPVSISVIGKKIIKAIKSLEVFYSEKEYEPSDLEGYFLVYACTNNRKLNVAIKADCQVMNILVNVVDNPELCGFVSPAIYKNGGMTVAVGSNASNVKQSITIRNKIQNFLERNTVPYKFGENKRQDQLSFLVENPEVEKSPNSINKGQQKVKIEPNSSMVTRNKVMLVGFGPGNPELLTIKAFSCLKEADIIFHDALLDSDYLQQFAAVKVPVGKRCGHHSRKQDEINVLLLEAARNGEKVVRLKGGDPMIFGRGGEELNFLSNHHIEVEVVPGITSGLAASAQYGIPLTQRLISSSVAFCQGHKLSSKPFPKADTLVFYMGANHQREIALKLIAEGWKAETPVALLSRVSFPDVKTGVATLKKLSNNEIVMETPLLFIVGNTIRNRLLRKKHFS